MQKRVTLKRPSVCYEEQETNEYTRQLVASALSLPKSSVVKITTPSKPPVQDTTQSIELPRFLKSSLRTPKSASAPCSPTSGMKSVQFSKHNLEDICLFRKAQTPLAISQKKIFWAQDGLEEEEDDDESDDEVEEEEDRLTRSLVFPNWPTTRLADIIDRKNKLIRIDKNSFSMDQDTLIGKVSVRNLDYHKSVTIRYTFDFWETINNVQANFYQGHKAYDVFSFKITVPKNATTLYFAINYKVGTQDYWDNNDTRNYEIQFATKKPLLLGNVIQPQSQQIAFEDKLKSRYDFSQSISQVKNNPAPIPSPPFSQKTLAMPIPTRRKSSPPSPSCHSPLATSPSFMDLNSQSYMELVNKYCFYSTSPSRSPMSING